MDFEIGYRFLYETDSLECADQLVTNGLIAAIGYVNFLFVLK